jgi:hypothetical protein
LKSNPKPTARKTVLDTNQILSISPAELAKQLTLLDYEIYKVLNHTIAIDTDIHLSALAPGNFLKNHGRESIQNLSFMRLLKDPNR